MTLTERARAVIEHVGRRVAAGHRLQVGQSRLQRRGKLVNELAVAQQAIKIARGQDLHRGQENSFGQPGVSPGGALGQPQQFRQRLPEA